MKKIIAALLIIIILLIMKIATNKQKAFDDGYESALLDIHYKNITWQVIQEDSIDTLIINRIN